MGDDRIDDGVDRVQDERKGQEDQDHYDKLNRNNKKENNNTNDIKVEKDKYCILGD